MTKWRFWHSLVSQARLFVEFQASERFCHKIKELYVVIKENNILGLYIKTWMNLQKRYARLKKEDRERLCTEGCH